ncbi:hypothetical protein Cob_v002927 [Colletotrichum orbiculare MAFF 240422]|uniref:Uncharacterized protein n=1 Tax=Colletotrichum orbiculare (strain 104-T / ATCC 96160 / CBS 514.97 / LARS 414 / MAFF 240422) TaxID=1213857 RepID=A0A484G0F7_COLOR|nr:hypothetical protein Cob_v002927 [Colletotrichum orbiculare MAFF 240422]
MIASPMSRLVVATLTSFRITDLPYSMTGVVWEGQPQRHRPARGELVRCHLARLSCGRRYLGSYCFCACEITGNLV